MSCALRGDAVLQAILAAGIHYIQQMRLNGGLHANTTGIEKAQLVEANRAYWVIYCLERRYSLSVGTFSVSIIN